ncbi:hypothetical protein HPB47_023491 [Ixodes persulcatus]|uniref:Uncharacterized protein n=1 Tax=Ixodes persulcatus TaxID=34615 RepID=A0AC60R0D3_IXOPE|nr:hypothetical protein HPB47_023491 [Ixodes persulcatus]
MGKRRPYKQYLWDPSSEVPTRTKHRLRKEAEKRKREALVLTSSDSELSDSELSPDISQVDSPGSASMTVLDEENASVASTSGQRSVDERFTEDPVSDSPSSEGKDDSPSSEEAGPKRETSKKKVGLKGLTAAFGLLNSQSLPERTIWFKLARMCAYKLLCSSYKVLPRCWVDLQDKRRRLALNRKLAKGVKGMADMVAINPDFVVHQYRPGQRASEAARPLLRATPSSHPVVHYPAPTRQSTWHHDFGVSTMTRIQTRFTDTVTSSSTNTGLVSGPPRLPGRYFEPLLQATPSSTTRPQRANLPGITTSECQP